MLNITIAVNHSAATTSAGNTVFPQFFAIGNDPIDFVVQDIAVIMIVAAIMLAITFKLKQPMVIGYIIAGMIIGPYTPPFNLIRSPETLNLFAELGIIMLLFVTGTEFPIAKLRSVGKISIATALAEVLGTLLIVFFIAQSLGFAFYDSLFLALALSITSTVITIRILEEVGLIRDKSSTLILGMLIVEDIIAISALGILQSFVATGGNMSIVNVAIVLGIVGGFIGGVIIIGSKFVPRIIDRAGKDKRLCAAPDNDPQHRLWAVLPCKWPWHVCSGWCLSCRRTCRREQECGSGKDNHNSLTRYV